MREIPQLSAADQKRFWTKVNKNCEHVPALENPDLYSHVIGNCWEWTGALTRDYGVYYVKGYKHLYAHRVSYRIATGIDPGKLLVCHHCDNPRCVRPDHFYTGDDKQNAIDKISRNRHNAPKGENHRAVILTEDQVREIYRIHSTTKLTRAKIGEIFGVTEGTIAGILSGEKWKHLDLRKDFVSRNNNFTEEDVKDIYYRYWTEDISQKELADMYESNQTHIGRVVNQKIWKNITDTVILPFKLDKPIGTNTGKRKKGKLSDDAIVDIFLRYHSDRSQRQIIAKEYGINPRTVTAIGRREINKTVTQSIAI